VAGTAPGGEKDEVSREEVVVVDFNNVTDFDSPPAHPLPLTVSQHFHLPVVDLVVGAVPLLILHFLLFYIILFTFYSVLNLHCFTINDFITNHFFLQNKVS
jgi:hypothetical protein